MFIHPLHHIFDKYLGLNVPAYSLLVSSVLSSSSLDRTLMKHLIDNHSNDLTYRGVTSDHDQDCDTARVVLDGTVWIKVTWFCCAAAMCTLLPLNHYGAKERQDFYAGD